MSAASSSPGRSVGDLVARVTAAGGVVRSSQLRRQGISEALIASAVSGGRLVRVRRRWVASPDADPYVVSAARAGVVLSCVTQARRLGLWVLAEDAPHVAAHPHAGRIDLSAPAIVHRALPLVARHPDQLVDPIENVLALVAACQPFESALAVWESALRHGHADARMLARLPLRGAAREILKVASPFSDSGLESFVIPRLRWTRLPIVTQVLIAGHHVDFLIGERLVLQIDGGHHVGMQREQDIRHDAQLMLMGFHVIRVGYAQVVDDWPSVQHDIMRAIAQGLHRA
jgi:very-short-patch-repair endonuclease